MHKAATAILISCVFLLPAGCLSSDRVVVPTPNIVENYESSVSKRDVKVLLVFGADWCRYCQVLKYDMAEMNKDGLPVVNIDTDERPDLKEKHNVKSLPTSVIMLNGKEISRKIGYEKEDYLRWLEKNRRSK